MDEKSTRAKTAAIVGIAALAVISLLIALFVTSAENDRREAITLPDMPVTDEVLSDSSAAQPEEVFVQLSTENVQSVLSGLSRPAFYHQALTLTTYASDRARVQQAELWVSGALLRATLTDDFETKSYLTDGQMLYVWYGDSAEYTRLALNGELSRDELTGVPTYEMLLALPRAALEDAQYLTLPDANDLQCVFVQSMQSGVQARCWVSLESGLLYRYAALSDADVFYTAQQTQLDLLAEGDESLADVFTLPDGSAPFSSAAEADTEG